MLAPNSTIKQTAKKSLLPRYMTALVVCCLLVFAWFIGMLSSSLASIAFGTIGFIALLLAVVIFVLIPLLLGTIYYFRRLTFEQDDSILVVFKYFSSAKEYKRALRFALLISIKFGLAALFVFSPCIIIALLSNETIYQFLGVGLPVWMPILWALNSFIAILAIISLAFITLKYYLSTFLFVSNDQLAPSQAIKFSCLISKRTGGDFFGLMFSFTPLMLLSIFVAPIVFTLPYILSAYCVHGSLAITAYNLDVDRFNTDNTPSYTADQI